jgi:hypothetical protein
MQDPANELLRIPLPRTRVNKAKTNRGMFGSLERRYFAGDLTDQGEERFEALIYALRSLYKAAL